jgi:hypothetical protein
VNGAVDMALITSSKPICLPSGVTIEQLRDIVLMDIKSHPEMRHNRAAFYIETSLATSFVCPAGRMR